MCRLLTHTEVTKPDFFTKEDFENYEKILIETDSIYQNNDISKNKPKSSSSGKYNEMIKPIWQKKSATSPKKFKEKIPQNSTRKGLKKYTEDPIEYKYIHNLGELLKRLYFCCYFYC